MSEIKQDQDQFIVKPTLIQYGHHVLIKLPSSGLKVAHVTEGGSINLGKFGTFDLSGIVGFPFGQTFEVLDERKVRAVKSTTYGNVDTLEPEDIPTADANADAAASDVVMDETSKENTPEPKTLGEKIDYLKRLDVKSSETNRDLLDIGAGSQALTMEEIETLKKTSKGANIGEAIIDKLIKSHANFNKKTIHSQEKYLKRKQQKFLRRFTVEYLGSSQLLQYYLEKEASKVLDMSEETLGLLLSLGNIQSGGRYLVIDETSGVLIAALLERMRGSGEIVLLHENEHPNISALDHSNFPIEIRQKMIDSLNLLQFFEPESERVEFQEYSTEELKELKSNKRTHYHRRKQNAIDTNKAIDNAIKGDFDALIVATTLYTPTLMKRLIESVGGSRPIIIYSQFKEPLIETQLDFMNDLRILTPALHESKARPYQTIPGRLHPMMTMRGGGGYLLSALRVYPVEEGVTAVGRGLKKKQKFEK
ncbi:tRNA (adenine-N(1)-)-methyltransferase non-catalytic subunit [Wickerhamomyces ciferrii]|uniref:tRNA (adenine(58)-N(1))-methyltransferase non-catalytic subunit TRM6 n=1 Tax=Wickerhamomyces ciferrii (strain ATCC 14091 / BCRC 22168 / CBS 111 / JCM 3599 / NBRC 0793 / NRRL Y-1031 F-60-10) TaxID=1206466 RepID=K0KHB5_WICCF|nr:tRNA (adenine-N(1)-)-methyltransferase non-catalytic subunit [Wickerhamomyces ciferrii]CCH40754.1 tRNA (adenine-N(1)-)-methyltransferase non-catalytic subunit [Wickerhamomyces ciferrii]